MLPLEWLLAPLPKVLWIELTSRCPLRCAFCTRQSRWGAGRDMDFSLYARLLHSLQAPSFIGLNYSGESLVYPHLLEAIELAAAAGAATELVTSMVPASRELLGEIVRSPLDRLAVSLHTMDERQYYRIYGGGCLSQLLERIDWVSDLRAQTQSASPRLDFCFVAFEDNLCQLMPVARHARKCRVRDIFIHPVIGRCLIPQQFPRELRGDRLTSTFKQHLQHTVAEARRACTDIAFTVLNYDLNGAQTLGASPAPYGAELPPGAYIHGCDQDPWESVHVLANGDVVPCEVHDDRVMGNLNESPLEQIWHSPAYQDFRRQYWNGEEPRCRRCPWKRAFIPEEWRPYIRSEGDRSAQLLRGWYPPSGNDAVWSKQECTLVLQTGCPARQLRLEGILPPPGKSAVNQLSVECNGLRIGTVSNSTSHCISFSQSWILPEEARGIVGVRICISEVYRPCLHEATGDARDLGFALSQIEIFP